MLLLMMRLAPISRHLTSARHQPGRSETSLLPECIRLCWGRPVYSACELAEVLQSLRQLSNGQASCSQRTITLQPSAAQRGHHVCTVSLSSYPKTPYSTVSTGLREQGATGSSINEAEIRKFQELAKEWWDPGGTSAGLHSMNPVRTSFTRNALCLCYG